MGNLIKALKSRYLNLSIVHKLNISYLVAIILPIILLASLSDRISSDIIIGKTIENSVQNLDLVTRSMEGLINHIKDVSKIVVADKTVQQHFNKQVDNNNLGDFEDIYLIRTILDNIIEPRTVISSIALYGYNGRDIGSGQVDTSKLKGIGSINESFITRMNENWKEPIFVDTHQVDYEIQGKGVKCISLIKPIIFAGSGKFIGFTEVNINEKTISNLYSNLIYGKTGRFFIINNDGVVVSSGIKGELNTSIRQYDYFKWLQQSNRAGKVFKIKSEEFLITCSKYEGINWIVVGIIPLDELIGQNKKVTYLIYTFGVACIILAFLFSAFISRSISKPIIKLSKSMNAAGQGNLDVFIMDDRGDEIGQLTSNFNKMVKKISSLMEEIYEEQRKKRKHELLALQAQIKPHFLYNTLESVCSLIQMGRGNEGYNMVKSLALFYRIVLSKGQNIITLREEIDSVRHYISILKIRYSDKLDYSIEVDENILDRHIIKLSIQPLVENSLYHGIKNKRGKGLIKIVGRAEGDKIIISVVDNGVGFTVEEIDRVLNEKADKPSFGLKSVDERLKLYFGPVYGIKLTSQQGQGAKVDIVLPNEKCSSEGDRI